MLDIWVHITMTRNVHRPVSAEYICPLPLHCTGTRPSEQGTVVGNGTNSVRYLKGGPTWVVTKKCNINIDKCDVAVFTFDAIIV